MPSRDVEMPATRRVTRSMYRGTDRAVTECVVYDRRIENIASPDGNRDDRSTRKALQMNHDQVIGKWSQIKGQAKKAWGELTDDDFKKAEGSVEKLYGVIQERFGDTREAIQSRLNKFDAESRKVP
jgi:uncharacterized protein YjbJ (UPF0337 family)